MLCVCVCLLPDSSSILKFPHNPMSGRVCQVTQRIFSYLIICLLVCLLFKFSYVLF